MYICIYGTYFDFLLLDHCNNFAFTYVCNRINGKGRMLHSMQLAYFYEFSHTYAHTYANDAYMILTYNACVLFYWTFVQTESFGHLSPCVCIIWFIWLIWLQGVTSTYTML